MIKPLLNTLFALSLGSALIPLASAVEQTTTTTTQNQLESESALLENGVKLWADNKPKLAEAEFKKAIKSYPKSSQAHARLAGLLLTQNKTSEAVPAYQEAITLDPTNPKLYASLSIAYLHQSKFSMAKAMADEALKLDPELTQVKKINEYITAKQEVMEQASTAKPNDSTHNGSPTEGSAQHKAPHAEK